MFRTPWAKLNIKQRITISYIAFILIPFCLLSAHSYIQSQTLQNEQISGNMEQTLTIVRHNIENQINLVENISHNITYNTRLQRFLADPFRIENGSLDLYMQTIKPLVDNVLEYSQIKLYDVKIFMNNHSIPEGYGTFYYDTSVMLTDWYSTFIESEKRSSWVTIPNENTYVYLQKITSIEGDLLGVVRVSLLRTELLDILDGTKTVAQGSELYIIEDTSKSLVHGQITNPQLSEILDKASNKNHFKIDGKLYIQSRIEQLGLTIFMTERIPASFHSYQLLTTASFILAIIISILLFYRLLKIVFVKIKVSIRAMDHSIRTGFNDLVPVDRNDEIGVINTKFNTLLSQINNLVDEKIKQETVHKDAQLKSLQAQINPHFLYNTINIFSAKAELSGLYDLSESFADFAQMLRYNMNNHSEYATIQQEVNHVMSYVRLQKLKYAEKLVFNWECDQELLNHRILRFILQPIVENSIIHGMREHETLQLTLEIKAENQGSIIINIMDNGIGIPPIRLNELNQFFQRDGSEEQLSSDQNTTRGIGLGNINNRMRLFYGEHHTLHMESLQGVYTKTTLKIPYYSENIEEVLK